MKIGFNVHNVTRTKRQAEVEYQGETIMADVPLLEVELTSTDGLSGSLTLRFATTEQIDEAVKKFPVGEDVYWEL